MLLLNNYKPIVNDNKAALSNLYRRSKSVFYNEGNEIKKSISLDEIDNPPKEMCPAEEAFFQTMKHEINRLNSFTGKWPISYVKPADLAENGFFYLQSEDKVQCAFCHVIVDDWNVGQKPLKEHIKKSLRCPFLLSCDVGNVPIVQHPTVSKVSAIGSGSVNSSTYKPKHPRMADLRKRLITYRGWPHISLSTQQLAECGLFYTGKEDHVECFFCGGGIGNWELNDDPWEEHSRFYPNCGYVNLVKRHNGMHRQHSAPATQAISSPATHKSKPNLSASMQNEIISDACIIFSKPLVEKVVMQHLKDSSRHFSSLAELCDAVLEYSEKENSQGVSHDVTGHSKVEENKCESMKDEVLPASVDYTAGFMTTGGSDANKEEENQTNHGKTNKDLLLCKICFDRQSTMAFQPCGHMVTCQKCAQVIYTCPLCRSPVTSKIKIYIG